MNVLLALAVACLVVGAVLELVLERIAEHENKTAARRARIARSEWASRSEELLSTVSDSRKVYDYDLARYVEYDGP